MSELTALTVAARCSCANRISEFDSNSIQRSPGMEAYRRGERASGLRLRHGKRNVVVVAHIVHDNQLGLTFDPEPPCHTDSHTLPKVLVNRPRTSSLLPSRRVMGKI